MADEPAPRADRSCVSARGHVPSGHALGLMDRVARVEDGGGTADANAALLRRWKTRKPFADPALFAQRLAAAGLTEAVFAAAIGMDPAHAGSGARGIDDILAADLAARQRHPDWRRRLRTVRPHAAEGIDAFPALVGPLLVTAYERLLDTARDASRSAPLAARSFARSAFAHLTGRVARMAQRCLLRALHRAREDGRLLGASPEERFRHFCALLADRAYAVGILETYPVLARQLARAVAQWESATTELLCRYVSDRHALERTFAPAGRLGRLQAVRLEAGDHHRDGRTVSILHFAGGRRLLYKPRSLAIDAAFGDLLSWMRDAGCPVSLRSPQVLDRGDHGWAEFIGRADCSGAAGAALFFARHGALLALFHVLCANDVHHENLIACGDFPVPVDLETLFQPDLSLLDSSGGLAAPGNEIFGAVTQTGLLPERIWESGPEGAGIDLSGLGGGGELSPMPLLVLDDVGKDTMRLVRRRLPVPPGRHSAMCDGRPVRAADHVTDILRGFAETYDFLAANRDRLTAPGGPLDAFAGVETRVLLRATYYYALILSDSFHPAVLGDGLERDLYFDRLWMQVPKQKVLARVVEAERADLWANDIPSFTLRPEAPHLWTSRGEKVADVWPQTPMARVKATLARLGAEDRTRQLWLVEKTLGTLRLREAVTGHDRYPVNRTAPVRAAGSFLVEAERIAARLKVLGFSAPDGSLSWMTCLPAGKGGWSYRHAGSDLYNGLAGICLFHAYLAAVTGHAAHEQVARGAWRTVRHILGRSECDLAGPGAFTGWGGLLYAAHHLSRIWCDGRVLAGILERLPSADALVESDRAYDIVDGAAGFIAVALDLVAAGHRGLLDSCIACGEHLLAHARTTETGLGWPLASAGDTPLGGFSHGTTGIAWALLRLAATTDDPRYREAALAALAYDRSLYCPRERNWKDLREGPRPGEVEARGDHFVVAWCHGAPGIGLGRLLIRDHLDDAAIDEEIAIAAATTLREGFGNTHSLCHGDLGNLEFLMRLAQSRGDRALGARCRRLAAGILESIGKEGWRTGYAPGTEPLGLMVGLAGIGYGLMKWAAPARVPSLLALEPPSEA